MAIRKAPSSRRGSVASKRTVRTPSSKKAAAKKGATRNAAPKTSRTRAPAPARGKSSPAKNASRRARAAAKTSAGKPRLSRNAAARKAADAPRAATVRRTAAPAPVDPSLFPCGDAAIRAATGKSWSEWLALLDAAGAANASFDHQRIWDLAMQALPETAAWWGQMVSVGYERARGLREKHETCAGDFQATVSRTFPVPLFAAFAAWADENLRRNWLDAQGLDFTRLNAGKNIRARWPDGARLDIRFNASGPDKCQIVVDTMKLADAEAVKQAKAFWQAQLERLRTYLGA
jgi:hypothetical protein